MSIYCNRLIIRLDPQAFAVLFGYYTYIESNHASAVQALDDLLALIENSNPMGFQAITEFKAELLQFPAEDLQPLTPEQLQHLHNLFPNKFPAYDLLFALK
jgi:hypothetical protein